MPIRGDDRVRLIDRHGGQTAEVTARGGEGLAALGLGGETKNGGVTVFGRDSRPGSELSIQAQSATTLVIKAPGGRIVDGDLPASELLIEVRRAAPKTREELELPPPLAEPRLDFRVDRASALSYEVKQGEYIQVIDVQGRQCSDFLAFHAAKLQRGLERGLDATVTRTLMGQAYPTPGLQGKFYDLDFDPLVEVIRDTVGRHDTFALACQAKYYEDLGYPGHINCTDNFNEALNPFAIAPRKGWEALNFFYNTAFDSNMQLVSDEPWSRPGDYVMLRAMTDLVCASSACPDDIDPSNAWEVTDVHVRVYSPQNRFSVAIAHRVTADAPPVLTQETAFHPRTSALTKSFLEYRGYWLPHCFNNEGGIAEYWACREKVVVMDLSPAPEVRSARTRRRDAHPEDDHARRAQAVGRAGRLHRGLQRDRRDDRRRHRVPPGRRQLPFHRRRRVRRGLAPRGRGTQQPARLGQADDRPAPQPGRPGTAQPGNPERDRLDAAHAAEPRRAQVVPLPDRKDQHPRRDPDHRLAHRIHGRARVRGVLPPVRRSGGLGRHLKQRANRTASSRSASRRSTWCGSSPG